MIILDADGVLTDGSIILGSENLEIRRFHVRDGLGIVMAKKAGLMVGLISGKPSEVVRKRALDLGFDEICLGCLRKEEPYLRILQKYQLTDEEVAYVGDDILDLPILRRVGFAIAVADSTQEVKEVAHYITQCKGGKGAIREVIDLILSSKGLKKETINSILEQGD